MGTVPDPRVRVALAALLALAALGAAPIQVFQPHFRTPAELAPLASDLLGSEGIAFADPGGRVLVLRGPPESVARVLEVLRQLDRRPAAYRIEFRLTRLALLRRLGIHLESWVNSAQIRLARLPESAPPISRLRGRSVLAMRENRLDGTVAALEGRPAELWIGTAFPEIQRQAGFTGGETRTLDSAEVMAIETGFRVTPRALPDGRVELEIAPVLAVPSREGRSVRAGVSTRLAAGVGRWLAVASLAKRGAAVSLDPFGNLDLRAGASDSVLLLRAVRIDSE